MGCVLSVVKRFRRAMALHSLIAYFWRRDDPEHHYQVISGDVNVEWAGNLIAAPNYGTIYQNHYHYQVDGGCSVPGEDGDANGPSISATPHPSLALATTTATWDQHPHLTEEGSAEPPVPPPNDVTQEQDGPRPDKTVGAVLENEQLPDFQLPPDRGVHNKTIIVSLEARSSPHPSESRAVPLAIMAQAPSRENALCHDAACGRVDEEEGRVQSPALAENSSVHARAQSATLTRKNRTHALRIDTENTPSNSSSDASDGSGSTQPTGAPSNDDLMQSMFFEQLTAAPVSFHTLKVLTSAEIRLVSTSPGTANSPAAYHPFAMGRHSSVYQAVLLSGPRKGTVVAAKVFRNAHLRMDAEAMNINKFRLCREYGVWGALKHRSILRMEGVAVLDELQSPALVSEYKELGNLDQILQKNERSFDRLYVGCELSSGLAYLHRNSIVHGDLTSANILVDRDRVTGLLCPLITGFGKSRILDKDGYTTAMDGPPEIFKPPELLSQPKELVTNKAALTPSSDVYSFSLILLQLVTGKRPYSQERMSMFGKIVGIINPQDPLRPTPELYPILDESFKFCWSIMQACWKMLPEERITSEEAHSWLHTCVSYSTKAKL